MCVSLAANNPSVVSCRKCCGALNASSGFSPSHSRLSKGFLSAQVFLLSRGLLKGPLLGAKILASSRHAKFCWNDLFMSAGMRCASSHQTTSLYGSIQSSDPKFKPTQPIDGKRRVLNLPTISGSRPFLILVL